MKTKLLLKPLIGLLKVTFLFLFLSWSQTAVSQITVSPWKMNYGNGAINIPYLGHHGNASAYGYMNIPASNSSGWVNAPVNSNGEIHYSVRSILSSCLRQLDFTYFETNINIPSNINLTSLKVSFSAADDGARAYIFNSSHPNGAYIGQIKLGQTPITANYSSLAVKGEINRLVIVQFDDCPSGNNLTGAKVIANGMVVPISNLTVSTTDASCNSNADGSATADAAGGQAPYSYLWSNGQTTQTATGLTAGNYTVTVTDAAGNTSTASAEIKVVDKIAPTVNTKNLSIALVDGFASITADDINDGTTDNCDFTLSINKSTFTCNEIGEHTIRLTATDASGNSSSETATVTIEGATPEVTISDFTAVQSQKTNTIFLGYGPQSINLSAIATGGESFSYEWTASTGEFVSNVAKPSINPTASTTYTVVVTNNYGCTATTSIEVCVIDARSYDRKGRLDGKVLVCHHTYGKKGTKHVMISISKNAVSKHIANHGEETDHGDSLGPCNATCVAAPKNMPPPQARENPNTILTPDILVYPNPSIGTFEIKIANMQPGTELQLIDISGKLVERQKVLTNTQSTTIGHTNLTEGMYILKIVSSDETIVKKLIVRKN